MPGHFTTLWKLWSTSTLSGRLAREAAEYMYCAGTESVKLVWKVKTMKIICEIWISDSGDAADSSFLACDTVLMGRWVVGNLLKDCIIFIFRGNRSINWWDWLPFLMIMTLDPLTHCQSITPQNTQILKPFFFPTFFKSIIFYKCVNLTLE
jgi:hypothetical protein